MSTKKLTPKQQRFIDEYLIDLNATQAAIIPIKAIAEKCDCSRQAIEKRAKVQGWTRNLRGCIDKVASEKQLKSSITREATNPPEPAKQSVAPHTVSVPVAPADAHAREGVGCYFGQKGNIKAFPSLTNRVDGHAT